MLKDELGRVAQVEQVAVYRNVDAEAIDPVVLGRIAEGRVDWITLTSSAITERLHALLPDEASRRIGRDIRLASLSPVTSATAERLGWPIAAEATDLHLGRPGRGDRRTGRPGPRRTPRRRDDV